MYYKFGFILLGLGLFFTCSPSQKTALQNRNEVAPQRISFQQPSSIKNLENATVSAKGKTVEPISGGDLSKIIKAAAGRTHLFVFWTKECADCLTQMQTITTFANHSTTPNYQLVFVNINQEKDLEGFSQQLQNRNLTMRSFWLNQSKPNALQSFLNEPLDPNQPFVLAVQNDIDVFKYLKGKVEKEELYSFLQPLSI